MTAQQVADKHEYFIVTMPSSDDFEFWRNQARCALQRGIRPDQIGWVEPGGVGDLFSTASDGTGEELPSAPKNAPAIRSSKRFLSIARNAALHTDPERFSLLYSVLWRLQSNACLMEDKADDDVRRLEDLDKSVRRDSHKMHAFVRFRMIEGDQDEKPDRFVAWFEPEHHIVRANAGFFRRRFANMHWSILTPKGCIHWDGKTLTESPAAERSDAPAEDAAEELWLKYFASTFNPARLKVGAMMSEMPKKYWKNMPETTLIPGLIANAQSRESQMVEAGSIEFAERPSNLATIASGLTTCQKCSIGCLENQSVRGEGLHDANLMIVGEQPGDQEDISGRPFVGPAGQLLDAHLGLAGIDRNQTYLTNAVKHFKFVRRGKRRIHQSPTAKEIDTCRWWLESERAIIKPKIILALGASAARAILGKTVSITSARGVPLELEDGSELWITAHPSYLLRLEGEARLKQEMLFKRDLQSVANQLNNLLI